MTEQTAWADFIRQIVDMPPINFRRSTKPEGAVGRPWLVGFHDGSLSAYAAVVYVVWTIEVNDDEQSSRLPGGPFGGPSEEPSGGPSNKLPGGSVGGPSEEPSGGPVGGPSNEPSSEPTDGPSGSTIGGPSERPIKQLTRKATLLMSKSRVSPVHGTTVPRAELQSLTVLSRLLLIVAS